ncbi:MAG: bifunctional (p)ppGpp synthetase/guanosine-3',5'-bis(diphosphate) 3'-pyrophosphohydrolase [Eubacteriales bacterium]|nr:bifunctional (p)ppGpp synthetase/guanosine-3',5'-bis(diphosphate) 3'-pyrophosphohydrolase [Eubacteriales bacterium]MDD4389482.1 bifunctional (p)ppGpp synthetase/guanosine-3',5'-bis(diphosphate) 3'-pyrophosphohydrolase [Eubacteriales bacterium]
MDLKKELLDYLKNINSGYDLELVERAYDLADKMHENQFRKSGEPYIIHPVAVVKILADLGIDDHALVAGMLHDVVEDTEYTKKNLTEDFGEEITLLVEGVTKLGSLKFETKEEFQAENLRKMFLAMSKDIRVLIIKLADRLHNMRTLNYMNEAKIIEKSRETLDIYTPLAARLGIYTIKFELEDIALKYLQPDAYARLVRDVEAKKLQRQKLIRNVINQIEGQLNEFNIHHDIMGRSKHLYSVYRKMKFQDKELDEIFDLTAVRIIVDTVRDCYAVLGIVHTMWKPIPGKFKDYVAMPKPNMYQSLHTTVIADNGEPFEIQIRTYEMHKVAEYGIAAHWKYKEGNASSDKAETKLAWLRQTLEWQKDINDPREFMETLRVDLFASQVFVFTPQGKVLELPANSTPLDFAFKIHSEVGYKCVGAKINGKIVPLNTKLENGNIVEIITSGNSTGPSSDWLKIARTSSAKNKIRQWLKKENLGDSIEKGKELLEKYIHKKGYDTKAVIKNSNLIKAVKQLNYTSLEDMYRQMANGGAVVSKTGVLLIGYYHEEKKESIKSSEKSLSETIAEENKKVKKTRRNTPFDRGIVVEGVDNLMIRMSRCCNPVPGDEIIGFITKGRGISVHRSDCANIISLPEEERARFIQVKWDESKMDKTSYAADLNIISEDRRGLIADLSRVCENNDININGVIARTNRDQLVNITMTVEITNIEQIEKVIRVLKGVPGVIDVYRAVV